MLQRLVHSARELAGARYAALGIPDGEGALQLASSRPGMSDELIAAMGPLPRTHGMLGAMLESPEPHRTDDIRADPRFRGWWPRAHPSMRSFLGVPIVARGEVIGALYLTEKDGGFSRRRREADRAARRARRDRDRERAPARAQPRAVDRRGAQPARARAARQRHAAAVRRRARRRVGEHAARARPRGRGGRDRARRRARPRRDGGAARGRVRAAARLAGGRGPRDRAAQARRRAAPRLRPRDRAARRRGAAAGSGARDAGAAGSPRRRSATRCATPRPSRSREARQRLRPARAERRRRRLRLRPRRGVRGKRLGLTSMEERATELGGHADRHSERGRHDRPAGGARVIRVVLADDHAVVRQGLRTFLDLQDDIEVVGRGGRRRGGRRGRRAPGPRRRPARPRDAAARRARRAQALRERPRARVIVLTSFGDDDKLFAALRGGAAGYLLKDVQPAELVRAIRSAHAGDSPLSPAIATRVVEEVAQGGRDAPRRPHAARARRADADRARALEQGDRARARRRREDGQDARQPHPRQARRRRPHAGGALRVRASATAAAS